MPRFLCHDCGRDDDDCSCVSDTARSHKGSRKPVQGHDGDNSSSGQNIDHDGFGRLGMPVERIFRAVEPNQAKKAPYAYNRSVLTTDVVALLDAAEQMKVVAGAVLQDRREGEIMPNRQTRAARRQTMKIYMRKYRARKKAEKIAALKATPDPA